MPYIYGQFVARMFAQNLFACGHVHVENKHSRRSKYHIFARWYHLPRIENHGRMVRPKARESYWERDFNRAHRSLALFMLNKLYFLLSSGVLTSSTYHWSWWYKDTILRLSEGSTSNEDSVDTHFVWFCSIGWWCNFKGRERPNFFASSEQITGYLLNA